MKLNAKHKRFCQEYVIDLNATQAAIRAGYSKRTARSQGQRLLTNVDIQKNISSLKKSISRKLSIAHENILRELENWAFSDITEALFISPEEIKQLPLEVRRLITKFEHTQKDIRDAQGNILETITVVKLSFISKEKAMEMINRHTGFYEKDNEQKAAPAFVMYDARKTN